MMLKWQWFLGGRVMFWIATIVLILFVLIYVTTFIVDPTTNAFMEIQNTDTISIKELSENYLNSLEVNIDKPIYYRFVKYRRGNSLEKDTVLLGSFHEWNNNYYVDISVDLYKMSRLQEIVEHEVRHMIVQELKNKNIIDLTDYSEEIAQKQNEIYDQLFSYSVELMNEKDNKE